MHMGLGARRTTNVLTFSCKVIDAPRVRSPRIAPGSRFTNVDRHLVELTEQSSGRPIARPASRPESAFGAHAPLDAVCVFLRCPCDDRWDRNQALAVVKVANNFGAFESSDLLHQLHYARHLMIRPDRRRAAGCLQKCRRPLLVDLLRVPAQ